MMLVPDCYSLLPENMRFSPREFHSVLKNVPFINYAFNKRNVYIAQCITTDNHEPSWLGDFIANHDQHNVINPLQLLYKFPQGISIDWHVKTDLLICALSEFIMLDLTKGPSVGASVEATASYIMGKPIYGVVKEGSKISIFSRFLCSNIFEEEKLTHLKVKE